MEFSIKFDTIKSGMSILYVEGMHAIISKNIVCFSLKIDFVFANSVDPDEMLHFGAFHMGLHCTKVPIYAFPI